MRRYYSILFILAAFIGCNTATENNTRDKEPVVITAPAFSNDSLAVIKLMSTVYQWHEQHKEEFVDFDVVVQDSLQVALDRVAFLKTYDALVKTNFFSEAFLGNYQELGDSVDYALKNANPKMPDEINFGYMDADSWNAFQDDGGIYWDNWVIDSFKQDGNTASLYWWLSGKNGKRLSNPYYIAFVKDNGAWKIDRMAGFSKQYFR